MRRIKARGDQKVKDVLMTKSETSLEDLLLLFLKEIIVGLVRDESLDDLKITSFTGDHERRFALVDSKLKRSSMFEENLDDRMMTLLASNDERSDVSSSRIVLMRIRTI